MARAQYIAAVKPAGPEPSIATLVLIYFARRANNMPVTKNKVPKSKYVAHTRPENTYTLRTLVKAIIERINTAGKTISAKIPDAR
jgi:hypothetical protein